MRLGSGPPVPGCGEPCHSDGCRPCHAGARSQRSQGVCSCSGASRVLTVTCPLLLVVPLVALSDAPLALVESVNVTVSPGTRLLLASVTVAVSVEVPLGIHGAGRSIKLHTRYRPGDK